MRHFVVLALVAVGLGAVTARVTAGGFTKADYLAGKPAPLEPEEPNKAGGDSCASPPRIRPVPFTDSGNTTGSVNDVRNIPSTCGPILPFVPGPDHMYRFDVGVGNNLTFTVSTTHPTYDPAVYVLGTCNDGTSCVTGTDECFASDFVQPSSCPSGTVEESFSATFAPGTYFLYIDSFYSSVSTPTRASGPYSLMVTGTLPVELLRFEVD